jgi:hypothetical protein
MPSPIILSFQIRLELGLFLKGKVVLERFVTYSRYAGRVKLYLLPCAARTWDVATSS